MKTKVYVTRTDMVDYIKGGKKELRYNLYNNRSNFYFPVDVELDEVVDIVQNTASNYGTFMLKSEDEDKEYAVGKTSVFSTE